jgi:hypothetical protein
MADDLDTAPEMSEADWDRTNARWHREGGAAEPDKNEVRPLTRPRRRPAPAAAPKPAKHGPAAELQTIPGGQSQADAPSGVAARQAEDQGVLHTSAAEKAASGAEGCDFAGAETFARKSKFRLEGFDTLQPGTLMWRVKGLWPAVGVCFVGGPSMAGKSFWMLDALANVRRGLPVLGRRSVPSGVIYVAAESPAGVRRRIAGLRSVIGPLGGGFDFIAQAPDLRNPENVENLRAVLREAQARQAALGIQLGIVCFDTLSAIIPGADENTSKDMSPVLTALQEMATELSVCIVVVAHVGKDETRGLRGWSGLLANADGLVMLESPQEEIRVGSVVKVKDGEAGDRFAFSLRRVELGADDDGDPVTTCVVQSEDAGPTKRSTRERRLSPKQALLLRAVHLCLEAGLGESVPVPEGLPPGTKGIHREKVKERARVEGYADDAAKPESTRRKLNGHITDLIGMGKLRVGGEYLWPI